MNQEQAAKLRAPFPADAIGKLPRITCGACSKAQGRVCDRHTKARCSACHNNITGAHIHLDYVGHAETTDRLLQVDPHWTWEPVGIGDDGLPAFDRLGGLWIRLTVLDVTRLGYGAAEGKTGTDAVKECIGDALRNAAMRFGVGLDLWGARSTTERAEPDPLAETDDASRLRARIAYAAQEKGYSLDDVPQMFSAHMRCDIRSASPARLAEFLDVVERWQPVEGART